MGGLFSELKRRNVLRMAAAYGVAAWLLIQIVAVIFPILGVPEWILTMVVVLVIAGFPISLIVSWLYEWTPEGVMTDAEADAGGYAKPSPFGRQIDFVIIALMAVAIGWLIYGQSVRVPPPAPEKSIAVLPFVNLSADPGQAYMADGISEELLNSLARLSGLKVVGRQSSFLFRGEDRDFREIGERLDVAALLEGSIRKSGNMLRITARLVNAADGYQLWSATYDREMADIFAIQDDISGAIVAALKVLLVDGGVPEPRVARTANPEAYDLYLQGRQHFRRRTFQDIKQARDYFKRTIESDPEYVPAYASLVSTLLLLSRQGFGDTSFDDILAEALPLIVRALEINPGLAETHASLGLLRRLEGDFLAAEPALKRAIELSPNMANAHLWLYITYDIEGLHAKAFEVLQRTFELDPLAPVVGANMAAELWSRGRNEEALIAAGRVIQVAPENPMGYGRAGRINWTRGNLADALGWYRKIEENAPGDPISLRETGYLYLNLGDYGMAERYLPDDWRHLAFLAEGKIEQAQQDIRALLPERSGERRAIVAAARTEIWAGNYAAARSLLEPLAKGRKSGRGPLFLRANIVFWDPAIGASDLVLARQKTGDQAGADELLAQVRVYFARLRSEGLSHPAIAYQFARILALEGRPDEALAELQDAITRGWRFWYTAGDPLLSSLHDRPEFSALISEMDALVAAERGKLEAE